MKRAVGALYGTVSVLSILCGENGAARAQVTAEAEKGETLGEIVVTARKREEKLQDIPAALNAFSSDAIETANVRSVDDIAMMLPNVSMVNTQNVGTAFINIRGVGQYRNSEPPVAVVIDGLQISSPNQITQDLYDIERIEVLKGPQGFLYGRNASGGAINIVTRQPGNTFEGMVRLSYANGDDRRIEGVVSGPVIDDTFLFRVSGSYRNFDGVLTNVTRDAKVDFVEDTNFRTRLIWSPSQSFKADLRYSYSSFDGGAAWFVPLPDASANLSNVPIVADVIGFGDRDLRDLALKLDYDFGFATLSSITSRTTVREYFFEDLDWTPDDILVAEQALSTKTWSQELRLTSPGSQPLRWMVGAYYLKTTRDLVTNAVIASAIDLSIGDLTDHNRAWALFGNADYDIAPGMTFTLGLRYDRDRRRQVDFLLGGQESLATFDALQPKIALSYKITPDVLTYASYSSGFRSGGFNATATFGRQYDKEVVKSGEIGVKSTLFGGAATFNAAAFYSDFNGLQQYVLDVNSGGQAIVSVPNAKIWGLEAELQARPTPNLRLFAAVGLQDSKIQSELIGFDTAAVGYPVGFSFIGNKIPLAYGYSANLGAEYELELGERTRAILRADYSLKGDMYWEANNLDKQSAVNLINATLTLEHGPASLSLWAKNLTGEDYYEEFVSREFAGTIFDVGFPASPRRYGLTGTLRF